MIEIRLISMSSGDRPTSHSFNAAEPKWAGTVTSSPLSGASLTTSISEFEQVVQARCKLGRIFDELTKDPDSDRSDRLSTALTAQLPGGGWRVSDARIAAVISSWDDYSIGWTVVGRHRNGMCKCK